jgi:predicted oxidoreductase
MSVSRTYHTEVAIIGGGIAGIVVALELLDQGKRVLLLDRDTEERFGGLAKESFGGIFVVGSPQQRRLGIRDDPELAMADWLAVADFSDSDLWPRRWAETYVNRCLEMVYHWLRRHGVSFFPVVHWVERGLHTPGNSVPRFHMVWGTGHRLVERLVADLLAHSRRQRLELCFGHHVRELVTGRGAVTGCTGVVEATGEDFAVAADAVVVASGGICGAIDRVRDTWYRPWGDPPDLILNGAHRFGTGEMQDRMAAVGGALTHLDLQWHYAAGVHHPAPDRDRHGLSLVPPKSALWINAVGRRIGPMPLVTAYDTRFLVEQICLQPGRFSWQILNWKIACKELAVSGAEFNEAIRDRKPIAFLANLLLGNKELVRRLVDGCQDFVVADTVPELTRKMNAINRGFTIDAELLEAQIRRYDTTIARGRRYHNDEQLRRIAHARQYRGDRVRTCKFQQILDPKAGPLLAIREFILARKSLGGVLTDLECRVLRADGEPVPGLYAVGEAAGFGGGGIHGKGSLEGTFLGSCVLGGQLAARAVAGNA